MVLETARSLVQAELLATDQFILNQLQSDIPLINQMVEYVLQCGGKRIRPLVLLLSAKAFNHSGEQPVHLAAVIELIHTATLLHDDVVDKATLRRGHKTANTVWGAEASVLVGDFLYSRAFQIVVNLRHQPALDIFAKATHYMAEGEILQLVNAHNVDTSEATYFEVITRKTAKLFEVAAELGVMLLNPKDSESRAMRAYGLDLGLAYQLIDDVLDYSKEGADTGKNIGNDLAEGKMTLLMIHALQKASRAEVAFLKQAIQTGGSERVEALIEIIESTGAIEYTANRAKQHARQACEVLAQIPASPYRESLRAIAEFVVDRSY